MNDFLDQEFDRDRISAYKTPWYTPYTKRSKSNSKFILPSISLYEREHTLCGEIVKGARFFFIP